MSVEIKHDSSRDTMEMCDRKVEREEGRTGRASS